MMLPELLETHFRYIPKLLVAVGISLETPHPFEAPPAAFLPRTCFKLRLLGLKLKA